MEKAIKFERLMKGTMGLAIGLCVLLLLLDIFLEGDGSLGGLVGAVAGFTTAVFSFASGAIKELKGEIECLKSGGTTDTPDPTRQGTSSP